MAALLAVGTTTASSDDFTLTGEATSLFLVAATAPLSPSAQAVIEVKSAAGVYFTVGTLSATIAPMLVLSGPGTYRVTRYAGVSSGVDRV